MSREIHQLFHLDEYWSASFERIGDDEKVWIFSSREPPGTSITISGSAIRKLVNALNEEEIEF